jgi:hypothetical protein
MKNINRSLLHFHVLTMEDLDTLIFEFEVVCRMYGSISDAKKLRHFPSTLKE